MYKLFLDDIRQPRDVFYYIKNPIYLRTDWVIVRDYDSFVKVILEKGMPGLVTFDHDLADEHYPTRKDIQTNFKDTVIEYDNMKEKTGYHAARWLVQYMIDNEITDAPTILIHTQNPVGRENIKSIFNSFEKFMNMNRD